MKQGIMSRAITGGREDAMRRIVKGKSGTGKKVLKRFRGIRNRVRSTRRVRNIVNRNKGAKPRKKK